MPLTTAHLDAGFAQVRHLFAAAPEDERVAALQPHHGLAFAHRGDHQPLDEGLRRALAAAALAHVHDARVGPGIAGQDLVVDQVVDQQHGGGLDGLHGLDRSAAPGRPGRRRPACSCLVMKERRLGWLLFHASGCQLQ
jgi:hypothetical protein